MMCHLFPYAGPVTDSPWLSDDQQAVWRSWLALTARLLPIERGLFAR